MKTTRRFLFVLALTSLGFGIGCSKKSNEKLDPNEVVPLPGEVKLDDPGHTLSSANLPKGRKHAL